MYKFRRCGRTWGIPLIALGVGILLTLIIPSVFVLLIIGIVCILVGIFSVC